MKPDLYNKDSRSAVRNAAIYGALGAILVFLFDRLALYPAAVPVSWLNWKGMQR